MNSVHGKDARRIANVSPSGPHLVVRMVDGTEYVLSKEKFYIFDNEPDEALFQYSIAQDGYGVRWPLLNFYMSADTIVRHAFGARDCDGTRSSCAKAPEAQDYEKIARGALAEKQTMLENLTSTQAQCTKLFEEHQKLLGDLRVMGDRLAREARGHDETFRGRWRMAEDLQAARDALRVLLDAASCVRSSIDKEATNHLNMIDTAMGGARAALGRKSSGQ